MPADGIKFQVNFKTPAGTLINVYGESVADGIATMNEMAAAADLIRTIERNLSGAAPDFAAAPVAAPAAVRADFPPAPAVDTSATASHACRHGAMVYKTGISQKTGKEWKAYMCPSSNRADQCSPEFVR